MSILYSVLEDTQSSFLKTAVTEHERTNTMKSAHNSTENRTTKQ